MQTCKVIIIVCLLLSVTLLFMFPSRSRMETYEAAKTCDDCLIVLQKCNIYCEKQQPDTLAQCESVCQKAYGDCRTALKCPSV